MAAAWSGQRPQPGGPNAGGSGSREQSGPAGSGLRGRIPAGPGPGPGGWRRAQLLPVIARAGGPPGLPTLAALLRRICRKAQPGNLTWLAEWPEAAWNCLWPWPGELACC